MKREIIKTGDGSTTIHIPEWNEQYHSKHGAIQEAKHVFIEMGLKKVLEQEDLDQINILEIGFGTGLNALVTWDAIQDQGVRIDYTGVEAYPVALEEVTQLNFAQETSREDAIAIFNKMHSVPWEHPQEISDFFSLTKQKKFFHEIEDENAFHLIYFDAFGARVQPELWSVEIFGKMYRATKQDGVLVTYAAKGSVRRAMLEVGYKVERLQGPPGKREMLRATKV